eukprot:gnl/TRDRNA2_/TRDRNA2_133564_c4_seq2.p1 gnl/TRDRNA2_/TRDRNA2_133564_c4~~gnl/TRDRNA2_/TRDRNA2_133564_c4_seq2.p1  ORF type:complete len:303 (-),score=72.20 gnl/TRDRNA2_/TRDRNA2_133564_c4_seq2:381-1154(-)
MLRVAVLSTALQDVGHPLSSAQIEEVEMEFGGKDAQINFWNFAWVAQRYRRMERDACRNNEGFTQEEVKLYEKFFRNCVADETGFVERRKLLDELPELFPSPRTCANAAAMLDSSSTHRLGFREFLRALREARNGADRLEIEHEMRAVKATNFTRAEVKEFRDIFYLYDPESSGELSFNQFKQMITAVVPVKGRAVDALKSLLQEVDEDHNNKLNFAEFLAVMRRVLDSDWDEISSRPRKLVDANSATRASLGLASD